MGFGKMISENRKYLRFLANGDTYASVGNHFNKVGRLKDISIAGLAFTYIGNTEDSVQDFSKATIFVSDSEFYLSDLACRIIYDSPLDETNNNRYFQTAYRINRIGIQFITITEYQLNKLKFFINNHAQSLICNDSHQF
jgi:hypothetical protein